MADLLERRIALRCAPDHAFRVFTEAVDLWWPRGHRKSTDGVLRFEPPPSGRLLDIGRDGSTWTMAVVTAFEPPERLALDWFPGSPAAPTHVEVTFAPTPAGTEIGIVHSAPTTAAAAIWPERVAAFTRGWEAVLAALQAHIDNQGG